MVSIIFLLPRSGLVCTLPPSMRSLRLPSVSLKLLSRAQTQGFCTNTHPLDSLKTLHIYRHLLRLAIKYPSIKRDKVIDEIQYEFRSSRNETDINEIRKQKETAITGISHLQKYTGFEESNSDWVVDLETDPMPMPPRPPNSKP